MFNGPFKIYEDYKIVPKPILSESATKAIEFYVQNFAESIPYVLAHEDLFFTTYRQKKTTRRTAKKFLTPGRQASLTYGGVRLLQKCSTTRNN